jgi:hypothetical protein
MCLQTLLAFVEGIERAHILGDLGLPRLIADAIVDHENTIICQELCLPDPIGSAEMSPGADHSPPRKITA